MRCTQPCCKHVYLLSVQSVPYPLRCTQPRCKHVYLLSVQSVPYPVPAVRGVPHHAVNTFTYFQYGVCHTLCQLCEVYPATLYPGAWGCASAKDVLPIGHRRSSSASRPAAFSSPARYVLQLLLLVSKNTACVPNSHIHVMYPEYSQARCTPSCQQPVPSLCTALVDPYKTHCRLSSKIFSYVHRPLPTGFPYPCELDTANTEKIENSKCGNHPHKHTQTPETHSKTRPNRNYRKISCIARIV